jgi:methionyl-tRNA formyltransferase
MPQRLILLTGTFDAEVLVRHFQQINPLCHVTWVTTHDALAEAVEMGPPSRLVSFCSGVIVSKALLDRMDGPSYNIHPGPPTFPGRYPECWGAYYGARRFGATLHVMVPRVDEGEIIDTLWFDVPEGAGQRHFGLEGFRAAMQLLSDWSLALSKIDGPLPANGEVWSGHKRSQADIDRLSRVSADIDAVEFERRRRAFAEMGGCSLSVELHGRVFTYTAPPATDKIEIEGEAG